MGILREWPRGAGSLRIHPSVPLGVLQSEGPLPVGRTQLGEVTGALNTEARSPETVLPRVRQPAPRGAPACSLSALGVLRPAGGGRAPGDRSRERSQPASQPAPRSPGVLQPRRSHAPSLVPAACRGSCGLCARGPGRPTAACAAAASSLASRRVPAVEGDGEGGDTASWRQTQPLRAQLRLETDGGGGGGTLPPPATGGGTPPSAAAAPSPHCTPAWRLRAGSAEQAGESSWHCPPRAPPRPAGDLLRAGEEPPPPPPDRLRAPGKESGAGSAGEARKVPSS